MKVLGIDPSLTATGVCSPAGELHTVKSVGGAKRGDWRLIDIWWDVRAAVAGADLVVIEDIPMNAMAAGITAQANAVVKLACMQEEVEIVKVAPATLKVFATGKGNCTKADVRMALYQRFDLDVRDDNQADAFWLWQIGLALVGEPGIKLPATHTRALDKVKWSKVDKV